MDKDKILSLVRAVATAPDQATALLAVEAAIEEAATDYDGKVAELTEAKAQGKKLQDANMALYLRLTAEGEAPKSEDDQFVADFEAKFKDYKDTDKESDDNA